MTFVLARYGHTRPDPATPRRDLGALAVLLGGIPLANVTFPSPRTSASRDLYPSADAAIALGVRAGIRAGAW